MPGIFGLFLLLFAAFLPANSQQVALSASDVAKRVDDHYNHLQSLKAGFTEEYDGLGMHRSESGVMLLRKPGKMRWEYQGASGRQGPGSQGTGKIFVLDGKYAWFYAPGDTQVQRIAASQLDDLRSPLRFLLGHTKIESELESLSLATAAGGNYTLSGRPKGKQQRIAKLSLTVTPSGAIAGIAIEESDGAQTRFNFTGEDPHAAIPESAFHFAPPAGVPVVDSLPPV